MRLGAMEERNRIWEGAVFYGRLADPFSTTAVESESLSAKLRSFLNRHRLAKDAIVMDAGCADGRVTHFLLDAGMRRIVSTDLDQDSVNQLVASLNTEEQERVLAIVDDFDTLPIASESIDLLVASALFAEMSDFRRAVESAIRMLKVGGLLFYFDPILEHALVYALVRNDLDEFLRVARTSTRARMWDQRDRRYRVYGAHQLEKQLLEHPELEMLERDGISMLPSLVLGGVLQDQYASADRKQELKDAIIALMTEDLQIFRQVIYVCRRRA